MQEQFITLSEAARLAPSAPCANSIWRWCRKGVKSRAGTRVKLAHVRVGGRVFTTAENLERFFRELAEADAAHFDREPSPPPLPPKRRTEEQRRRAVERAKSELQKYGV